jgi:hypothetical protein
VCVLGHGKVANMTKQESFKRRIRERMEKTGERYAAARRALISPTASPGSRIWVSQPEFTDEVIRTNTGKSWNEWCDLIDEWPGHIDGHTAIARHIHETTDLNGWWSQGVTVGYERITGLRLPHQMADGTFTASKSRTMDIDVTVLRELLVSDDAKTELFRDVETELRSRATAKTLRIAVGPGIASFSFDAVKDGRTKVTVAHEKLPTYDDVEQWKFYWSEWLDAVEQG